MPVIEGSSSIYAVGAGSKDVTWNYIGNSCGLFLPKGLDCQSVPCTVTADGGCADSSNALKSYGDVKLYSGSLTASAKSRIFASTSKGKLLTYAVYVGDKSDGFARRSLTLTDNKCDFSVLR